SVVPALEHGAGVGTSTWQTQRTRKVNHECPTVRFRPEPGSKTAIGRLYADRAVSRDQRHRRAGRAPASRAGRRARAGPADGMPLEHAADRSGASALPPGLGRTVPALGTRGAAAPRAGGAPVLLDGDPPAVPANRGALPGFQRRVARTAPG